LQHGDRRETGQRRAAPRLVLRAPHGIRLNAVAPAFERTRLVVGASAAAGFRR